mgnify:CR=1 FL=1
MPKSIKYFMVEIPKQKIGSYTPFYVYETMEEVNVLIKTLEAHKTDYDIIVVFEDNTKSKLLSYKNETTK